MKLANIDIGLCGEYYVCAQMHLKGWTASMTLKNYPGIDILGYNTSWDIILQKIKEQRYKLKQVKTSIQS